MPRASRLDQDEDLQLAIALTKSLMMPDGGEDDAVESNPGSALDKPLMMEHEEEHEERRVAEQLQAFFGDAQRVLQAADSTGDELHALIPCAHSTCAPACSGRCTGQNLAALPAPV